MSVKLAAQAREYAHQQSYRLSGYHRAMAIFNALRYSAGCLYNIDDFNDEVRRTNYNDIYFLGDTVLASMLVSIADYEDD